MDGNDKAAKIITVIFVIILIIYMIFLVMCDGSSGSSSRGDGKSTCRNCGREKSLNYMGYCSTCQEGFNDWQERYYDD